MHTAVVPIPQSTAPRRKRRQAAILSVKCPMPLMLAVDAIADAEQRSRSDILRDAMREIVARYRAQADLSTTALIAADAAASKCAGGGHR